MVVEGPLQGADPVTEESVRLDEERQRQARRYARIRRRLLLLDLALGGLYLAALLASGASVQVAAALRRVSEHPLWLVGAYVVVVMGVYGLALLPLSFYSGYVLPHRFGLSTQTVRGWITDQVKGALVGGVLGLALIEAVYALLRAAPETWWLWAGIGYLFFTVVMANLAPILLVPLFFRLTPIADSDLSARLTRLAERAGTRVRGVFTIDLSRRTKAANAAIMGLGNTRRIVLGDTLLREFTPDEIETVLAHELGHHVHHDIPLLIAGQSVLTLGGLYLAHRALTSGAVALGFGGPDDIAAFPLFMLAMSLFGLAAMPLANALSRWRERLADDYALSATGKPLAFASALTRLANQNLAEINPEPWVVWLLHDHPPLGSRIAAARRASSAR
jgi:STE24 endopeptidase